MAKTINQEIAELNDIATALAIRINQLSNRNVDVTPDIPPYSKVSGASEVIQIADVGTGSKGSIAWNNSELVYPPKLTDGKPPTPDKGYNKHFHTRFAGGALDINSLEIVEYDVNWTTDETHNQHCQQYWVKPLDIKTQQNSKQADIPKIGTMAFVFDADSVKWGASAFEIDVEKCFFVQKNPDGTIKKDENNIPMRAKIYNADVTKTNILWDKTALMWRWLAVYAETPTS